MKNSQVAASIVVPTFNRSDALLETLHALARMDYPADRWEAIVVDDGSTDGTAERLHHWIKERGAPVRCIEQKNSGPAAARNRGAAEARGETLIFIDNDIGVQPDFVRAHLQTLSENSGCWVIGRIVHPPQISNTPFGCYRNAVWESFHELHAREGVTETAGMSAANVSMPASDFKQLGGFDEDFTIASSEDWDLGMRARQRGIRVVYNPQIVVVHNDWAVSLERFCERQRLYSVSDVLLWRKYGESSPRARLVHENTPVRWSVDPPGLIAKKILKTALSLQISSLMVRTACKVSERFVPGGKLNRRAYNLAVGQAIFSGVREGLKRYDDSFALTGGRIQLEKG